ncbi:hypothetical protein MTO96_040116 [Rhipicephalus appendiculatus]
MEVVETEGETLSPEEFNDAQGWVVAHQRRRKAKDKANAELATNAGGASKEAPRKLHDFLHRRPAPKEPQLPEDDYKINIQIKVDSSTQIQITGQIQDEEQGRHLRESPKRVLTAVGAAGQR